MRFFALLNLEHVILYIFPTLIFIIIFGLSLARSYFKSAGAGERMTKVHDRYPDDIEGKNAPFPVALALITIGTVVWAALYIGFIGSTGVKI